MHTKNLDDWLSWQLRVHPREIELGLDRVTAVWKALGAPQPARVVITVGGTNGKGSTVAFLESMLGAAGYRVGAFTSPHLLRYNERVRIAGRDAADSELIEAFARIEAVRGDVPLTYFEFGTLAALLVFAESQLDVALLEVGLGGRLDAVNMIDADASIVTTVDLDHQDWLGNNREIIAREKAGIFRRGRPAIVGDPDPPESLLTEARRIGSLLIAAGAGYRFESAANGWAWSMEGVRLELPHAALDAPCQRANAAAAIATLRALDDRLEWNVDAIKQGVAHAHANARLQRFEGPPELIVDVAHNPQAARVLAEWLASHPTAGRNIAVFGALADKDVIGIVGPLRDLIHAWCFAGLDAESPRGLSAHALEQRIGIAGLSSDQSRHGSVKEALDGALAHAGPDDRIIAFGSFFVASAGLRMAAVRATGEI
ncbi:bifunctional tetrahydrofolate synthase/dihydrofolate synthase [Dokdonella sp.]|uniref:bifunctional tetrahydrofolate synthase/dihydrofolate synthase n=1 Tax=Dokdonella sp. TaxID=2291710 RepID=UPI003C5BE8E7